VAVAGQVAQLDRLSGGLVLGGQVLDRLQGRLVHDAGVGEVHNNGVRVLARVEQFGEIVR